MKKTSRLLVATIVAVSLLLQGCATILGGSKDSSRVRNGYPEGAKVYYNGNYIGNAPTNVKINKQCKKGQCYLEIKANGYESQKIEITRKISVGYAILDICTGVIWLVVDFTTGNIYKPRPNKISYNLTPIAGHNPAKTYDFKKGDKVLFTKNKYKNVEGEIVAVYPDRALIKFKRKPTIVEKVKGILDAVEDQIEVSFVNIAKK